MFATYVRGRWALVLQIVGALFLWSWVDTPVDPAGENAPGPPFVVLLTASLPLGLVFAALTARAMRRGAPAGAVAWVGAFLYGIWLGGWTSVVGTSAGRLECEAPDCRSAWGPRVVTFVTAIAVVFVCARVEAALRERWSSGPS